MSCLQSSLARELDAKNPVSQFAKGTQPLHWILVSIQCGPIHFSTAKKQTSPAFALLFKHPSASNMLKLAHAEKQAHIRLVHIFTTNSTGELPNRSNHRHWERFHTTLNILRHGQTQAQPQLQHTHTHCTVNQLQTHTHTQMKRHNLYSLISAGKTFWMAYVQSALASAFNLFTP